jgi:hypothetical protein
MSEKEPEQILEKMFDLLRELEKVKVKGERPIPIVKDRQGRFAKDLTVKDWVQKINEEIDELKNELMGAYLFTEIPCLRNTGLNANKKELIVGELCDVIEVLYSMANQMGIDGDMIQQGIHDTNKKLRERGCID